jgi:hypothetical protein
VGRHVFISYSHADKSYVDRLAAYLVSNRLTPWYDEDLSAGDRFDAAIQQQIDTCAAFVVVLTPDSAGSSWVNLEIGYAQQRAKPILPLMLTQCPVPFLLNRLQYEDVSPGRLPPQRFIDTIRQLVAPMPYAPATAPIPASPPAPASPAPTSPVEIPKPPGPALGLLAIGVVLLVFIVAVVVAVWPKAGGTDQALSPTGSPSATASSSPTISPSPSPSPTDSPSPTASPSPTPVVRQGPWRVSRTDITVTVPSVSRTGDTLTVPVIINSKNDVQAFGLTILDQAGSPLSQAPGSEWGDPQAHVTMRYTLKISIDPAAPPTGITLSMKGFFWSDQDRLILKITKLP